MSACMRCEWQSDPEAEDRPREQLVAHAVGTGHRLCACCGKSLTDAEADAFGCESCLTGSRETLAGILLMWDELGSHLGHIRGASYDRDRPGADDGRPLPGGTVAVLSGPGSTGTAARRLTTSEQEAGMSGREHGADNLPTDGYSTHGALTSWESDWRETAGHEIPKSAGSLAAQTRRAAGYLEIHAFWAARKHPAFPEYVTDLRDLHAALEQATGRSRRQVRAEAECFGCGQDALVREITDTGYADDWTCQRCGETYSWERYLLALRARLEQREDDAWGLPAQVAYTLGVLPRTVRGWCERGLVAVACRVGDRRMRVSWRDAHERGAILDAARERRGAA